MSDITINSFYNYLAAQAALMTEISNNLFKYNLEKKDLKGSGQAAIVLNLTAGDSPRSNRTFLPRLNCSIYADDTRASGLVTKTDKYDRMWRLFAILDPYLHWNDHKPKVIDGMRITGCQRAITPQINEDKDAGLEYLWAAYDIAQVL